MFIRKTIGQQKRILKNIYFNQQILIKRNDSTPASMLLVIYIENFKPRGQIIIYY